MGLGEIQSKSKRLHIVHAACYSIKTRACVCASVGPCVRAYVREWLRECVYMNVFMPVCVSVCVYLWVRACVHACVRACERARVHVCVHHIPLTAAIATTTTNRTFMAKFCISNVWCDLYQHMHVSADRRMSSVCPNVGHVPFDSTVHIFSRNKGYI
jgi:hypothetical protein